MHQLSRIVELRRYQKVDFLALGIHCHREFFRHLFCGVGDAISAYAVAGCVFSIPICIHPGHHIIFTGGEEKLKFAFVVSFRLCRRHSHSRVCICLHDGKAEVMIRPDDVSREGYPVSQYGCFLFFSFLKWQRLAGDAHLTNDQYISVFGDISFIDLNSFWEHTKPGYPPYSKLIAGVQQVGFVLVAPSVGAFYAFGHGLAKACLFLSVIDLPDRDLVFLRETSVSYSVLWPIRMAALSIAGCPLLIGFGAKSVVFESLSSIPYAVMTGAAIGTAALMARLIFVSRQMIGGRGPLVWSAPLLLCLPLILIGVGFGSYELSAWLKAGGILVVGVLLHGLGLKRVMSVALPNGWEKLEHVVGFTCMVLLTLMLIGELI